MTLEARRRRLASISRFAFPLAVMAFQATAADGSPLSVCDAIAKRIENNRRVVDVRGDVMAGGHGIYLASNKCADELVARGVTWPNFINLVLANNSSPNINEHAPFETDSNPSTLPRNISARPATGLESTVRSPPIPDCF